MNIEEGVKEIEKIKEMFIHLKNYGWINDIKKEIDVDKAIESIENLLTAYEKEKEKNNNAYIKANNYLYFNDSTDYEVALWEVIRKLRPDLAEKWDNGEDVDLEYIEEE